MVSNQAGLGRLMNRYRAEVGVPIRWDVRTVHRLFGRNREESVNGRIVDISLEGALIEVPMPSMNTIGEQVLIEFDSTQRALVEICHIHNHTVTSGDQMRYGVMFVDVGTMRPAILGMVDSFSGRPAEKLLRIWNEAK